MVRWTGRIYANRGNLKIALSRRKRTKCFLFILSCYHRFDNFTVHPNPEKFKMKRSTASATDEWNSTYAQTLLEPSLSSKDRHLEGSTQSNELKMSKSTRKQKKFDEKSRV